MTDCSMWKFDLFNPHFLLRKPTSFGDILVVYTLPDNGNAIFAIKSKHLVVYMSVSKHANTRPCVTYQSLCTLV